MLIALHSQKGKSAKRLQLAPAQPRYGSLKGVTSL